MIKYCRILDAAETQIAASIGEQEWVGIACRREGGNLVIEGDGQIPDGVRAWLAAGGAPTPYAPPVAMLRAQKIAAAWTECQRRCAIDSVIVTTSAGAHAYGVDDSTRSNVQTVMIGLLGGLTPNPRPWTPKGALASISVTHDDLKLIAAGVGARFDAMVQSYLTHKAAIMALATAAEVAAYDLNTGWPA